MAELEAMQPRFSQYLPGQEIPEKHWMYRLAKRYWFNDFAAYRKLDPKSPQKISTLLRSQLSNSTSNTESDVHCSKECQVEA